MGSYRAAPKEGLGISSMVKHSDRVFIGEVIEMEYVFREDLPPQDTTDITIKVEKMIKGEPNAGEDRVKFMIGGGEGIHPITGEKRICLVVGAPEFEIGEWVLIFLKKNKRLIEHRHIRQLPPPPYEGVGWRDGETERYCMKKYLYPIRSKRDYLIIGSGGSALRYGKFSSQLTWHNRS